MELLERHAELGDLRAAVDRARRGRGATVLVSGEAGIGKTSLLTEFVAGLDGTTRVLFGACEALLTPRILGPFRDMARGCRGGALRGVAADDRDAVIDALLDEMSIASRPAVVIVEDAHWADGASLDVVRYLARRVERLPALLVVSYRDDELADDHPLRRVVGAIGGAAVLHVELAGLSDAAVRRAAADAGVDAEPVVAAVGGNPFYLSEVLAARDPFLPPSVRHAVLARVALLPPACRRALERLAVVPAEVQPWLVDALLPDRAVLADAERRGIIVAADGRVRFRHELARRAVELATPQSVRVALHHDVLRALAEHDPAAEASRLVHHAVAAGDEPAVAGHAAAAARDAAAAGSHREAAAFALLALRHGDGRLGLPETAALHGLAASALRALNRFGEAMEHATLAVRLWDETGVAPAELGEALLVTSRLHIVLADPGAARSAALRARDVLEPLGRSPALALCYATLGGQDAVTGHFAEALQWAERALGLAAATGGAEAYARALGARGIAGVALGEDSGMADLEGSVAAAEHAGLGDCLAVAAYNLAVAYLRSGHPEPAQRYLLTAERAAREHALDALRFPVEAQWGHLLLWRGEWDRAQRRLRALLSREGDPGANLVLPLSFLARLLARRGDAEAGDLAGRAWRLAASTGERQKMATAGGARIEVAWLHGDTAAVHAAGADLLEVAAAPGQEFLRGEVLRYLRRAGATVAPFPGCPLAAAAGIAGDWAAAAKLWAEAGNPYEEALELAEAPEPAVALRALEILDRLGAVPAAAAARYRLRREGVRGVPRGPSAVTRANPGRLTARQHDVLRLLVGGCTNAEIAARLHVSRRTVDNHVAALLARLGVPSRRAAAARAADLGLLHEF